MFLDPVAALHGDLGIISPNGKDIAILISYSGSTSELLHLAPILRSRCASVISLSGNKDSQLARTADIAIDAAIGGDGLEADMDVPAPSSSLAVSMGLLDALALSALRENVDGSRSKAQSAFLSNHPGGHLGRQLTTALSTF